MKARRMPGHLIRRLNQYSTQVFTKRIQEAGIDLTSVQFAALDAIISRPGIDQATVADMIACDRATTGGVIDRLQQRGYVERTVCERDRRAREVRPTEKGVDTFEEILPIVNKLQKEILTGLNESEQIKFMYLAGKILGNHSEVDLLEIS